MSCAIEIFGIDVGAGKGVHVVSLRGTADSHARVFELLGDGVPVSVAVRLCRERAPACVAIDAPPGWARSGTARQGELALVDLGLRLFRTPSDLAKQQSRFYDWMRTGFDLFTALASIEPSYPLYREGAVNRHALEVFPHASAVVLAGRQRPATVGKHAWRRQVLEGRGFDTQALPNADSVDAALAALTGWHTLRDDFSAFGDPAEGRIVLPRRDAERRLRACACPSSRRQGGADRPAASRPRCFNSLRGGAPGGTALPCPRRQIPTA